MKNKSYFHLEIKLGLCNIPFPPNWDKQILSPFGGTLQKERRGSVATICFDTLTQEKDFGTSKCEVLCEFAD